MNRVNQKVLIELVCNAINLNTSSRSVINDLLSGISQRDRAVWKNRSPLIEAAKMGNKSLVNGMIYDFDFDINSTTKGENGGEWCALAAVIHGGDYVFAKYLIASKNVDLSVKTRILTDAIRYQHFGSVRFVLDEMGGDINIRLQPLNWTKHFLPLHLAIAMDANQ